MSKYSLKDLDEVIRKSYSWSQVCRSLNISTRGRNTVYLRRKCEENNIDYSHFNGKSTDIVVSHKRKDLEEILKENTPYNSSRLKKRLIEEGVFENICSSCGQLPLWMGKPLVLTLDHINGNSGDNRIENLRILCLHCHSQTETYAGKNSKVRYAKRCLICDIEISWNSKHCRGCANKLPRRRVEWPCICEILALDKDYEELCQRLQVSRSAIAKRLKLHECRCD